MVRKMSGLEAEQAIFGFKNIVIYFDSTCCLFFGHSRSLLSLDPQIVPFVLTLCLFFTVFKVYFYQPFKFAHLSQSQAFYFHLFFLGLVSFVSISLEGFIISYSNQVISFLLHPCYACSSLTTQNQLHLPVSQIVPTSIC